MGSASRGDLPTGAICIQGEEVCLLEGFAWGGGGAA